MSKIASFDIFDTLITRAVGHPKAVFLLMGNYLSAKKIIRHAPEVFANARIEAEPMARNKRGIKEVCLADIYRELDFILNLGPEKAKLIMDLECKMESRLLREVPGAKDRVKKAEKEFEKIIYISDMYHSSEFIKSQMKNCGFNVNGNCYVSSELLKTKRSGELFRHVAKECPAEYFHFGDNLNSDVNIPLKLKWKASHFKEIRPSRYERILNAAMWETGGLSAAMAGASRLVRLAKDVPSTRSKTIRDISAGVVAPTLVSYILWVLQRAADLKLKKLYFISRDGQIFLKIAEVLIKKLDLNIELQYLYGSRKAWQFSSLTEIKEGEIGWILKYVKGASLTTILSRVHLKPEEIEDTLLAYNYNRQDWEKELSLKQAAQFKQVILDKKVKALILEKVSASREIAYKYFQQEGLTEPNSWAIVDIGWGGNGQIFMGKILNHYGCQPPRGFYFALKSKTYEPIYGIKEGYIWDRVKGIGFSKLLVNLQSLMETFCNADHGSVIELKAEADEIVPVLEYKKNDKAIDWGLKLTHETVVGFTEFLFLESPYLNPRADMRPAVAKIIQAFGRNPTISEARAWGAFIFEDLHGQAQGNHILAQPYMLRHLFKAFLTGNPFHYRQSWLEGSLALSSKPMQKAVKAAAKMGFYVRKMIGKEEEEGI